VVSDTLRAFVARASVLYERIFSIHELRQNVVLKWLLGALLVFFFLNFSMWFHSPEATIEGYQSGEVACWPYFQNCGEYFFLHSGAVDYSKSIFYMALYGAILLAVWAMWRGRWGLSHFLLLLLTIWEALVAFVFSYWTGPYYTYHVVLAAILLVATHKEYFARLAFVLFYFLSAPIKFDDTWILGTYFSATQTGLPIFPDALIPLFSNIVIFSQVVGCWFLLSSNKWLQRWAFIFFVAFHLYSGVLVGYFFPTAALLPLLVLFGPLYQPLNIPFGRKTIVGWIISMALIAFSLVGFLLPGDRKLTQQGNRFGFFMFEANHQCAIEFDVYLKENVPREPYARWENAPGTSCTNRYCQVSVHERSENNYRIRSERYESGVSHSRCDPYNWLVQAKARCREIEIEKISFRLDHSINGGPLYRIVDEDDACTLTYKPFGENSWISEPPEAPVVGYPNKNFHHF